MPRSILVFLLTAVFTATLAGCGQKGPLYLPADEPDQTETPANPSN
ncbi:MAG: lipoprotein [Guyparkeria sp.]